MKINASIDLDELWTGSEWSETVASMITDELRAVIRAEIKKSLKDDPKLKKMIAAYKTTAIQQAMEKVGLS